MPIENPELRENVNLAFMDMLGQVNTHFEDVEDALDARKKIMNKWEKVEEKEIKGKDALDDLCENLDLKKPKDKYDNIKLFEGEGIINAIKRIRRKIEKGIEWVKEHKLIVGGAGAAIGLGIIAWVFLL